MGQKWWPDVVHVFFLSFFSAPRPPPHGLHEPENMTQDPWPGRKGPHSRGGGEQPISWPRDHHRTSRNEEILSPAWVCGPNGQRRRPPAAPVPPSATYPASRPVPGLRRIHPRESEVTSIDDNAGGERRKAKHPDLPEREQLERDGREQFELELDGREQLKLDGREQLELDGREQLERDEREQLERDGHETPQTIRCPAVRTNHPKGYYHSIPAATHTQLRA